MEYGFYRAPWGKLLLIAEDDRLVGLRVREDPGHRDRSENTAKGIESAKEWLDLYFSGEKPSPKGLKLLLRGSDFQQEVWRELLQIPYGETMTYGEIAKVIAKRRGLQRMSAQAVGGAVGRNPIGIIVPCHRVVGSNGSLVGYAGGLEIKRRLLCHEGVKIGR